MATVGAPTRELAVEQTFGVFLRSVLRARVAWMSAGALAGRVGCALFTDLENPISNRIYERIGQVRQRTFKRYAEVR
jgi:hypothetical protein